MMVVVRVVLGQDKFVAWNVDLNKIVVIRPCFDTDNLVQNTYLFHQTSLAVEVDIVADFLAQGVVMESMLVVVVVVTVDSQEDNETVVETVVGFLLPMVAVVLAVVGIVVAAYQDMLAVQQVVPVDFLENQVVKQAVDVGFLENQVAEQVVETDSDTSEMVDVFVAASAALVDRH